MNINLRRLRLKQGLTVQQSHNNSGNDQMSPINYKLLALAIAIDQLGPSRSSVLWRIQFHLRALDLGGLDLGGLVMTACIKKNMFLTLNAGPDQEWVA